MLGSTFALPLVHARRACNHVCSWRIGCQTMYSPPIRSNDTKATGMEQQLLTGRFASHFGKLPITVRPGV